MVATVFIDGEVGTTGLQIRQRLETRADIHLLSLDDTRRKDPHARAEMLNRADVSILCLPDDAAREAVSLVENKEAVLIDASTAHRTADGWTYGFPEMTSRQVENIAEAKRITNPGCYPQGAIALIRPLIDAGLVSPSYGATVNAISGYSGGGRAMIESYEDENQPVTDTVRAYALTISHKHVPELRLFSGLQHAPLFQPTVGRYYQGMIVSVPIHTIGMDKPFSGNGAHEVLNEAYKTSRFISVSPMKDSAASMLLSAESNNHTNEMNLHVLANEDHGHIWLIAVYDNLGKGASGAAVQNMNIVLGCDESEGLI